MSFPKRFFHAAGVTVLALILTVSTVRAAVNIGNTVTVSGAYDLLVAAGRGLDVASAGALTVGGTTATSVTIGRAGATSVTVTTDGTGTAEVVLPNGSIGSAEITDGAITPAKVSVGGVGSSQAWSITGTASSLTPTSGFVRFSSDGVYTLAGTPTIVDGASDGQLLMLSNVGSNAVTFQAEAGLAGSNINLSVSAGLPATMLEIDPDQSLTLVWDSTSSVWRLTALGGN